MHKRPSIFLALILLGHMGAAAWSPDGSRFAYVGAVDISDPAPGQIYVAAAAGEGVSALAPTYPGHVDELQWRAAVRAGSCRKAG